MEIVYNGSPLMNFSLGNAQSEVPVSNLSAEAEPSSLQPA